MAIRSGLRGAEGIGDGAAAQDGPLDLDAMDAICTDSLAALRALAEAEGKPLTEELTQRAA